MSTDIMAPEEEYKMSPEMVTVVTSYLETNDTGETARSLGIPREKVTYYLNKPEAKRFIDTIFLEQGYLNRSRMQDLLDELIEGKLEEMREAEMASNKDILDILNFAWRVRQDTLKEIETTNKTNAPTHQTNIQNNIVAGAGENYNALMGKLLDIK